ncbi:MAG: TolC family protein [Planctomycetia bacterium]|nr:TolC family protein [Planctomycetia bacterium]
MSISLLVLNRRTWKKLVSLALAAAMLPGCSGPDKKISYLGDPAPLEVHDHVMEIDHPELDEPTPDAVKLVHKPRRLGDRNRDEIWDLSLAEALHMALTNSRILRVRGDYRSAGSLVMANPDNAPSQFDPSIRDSGVLFGGRGVEAALAQFDPIFNTQMVWGSNSAIQNNSITSGGLVKGNQLNSDTGTFTTGIVKNFAYGANFSIAQNINYQFLGPNIPTQLFPSVYTGNVQMQYTQPLWAGAGTEFARIAGPFSTQLQGVSGVNQGVVISRINTDMSIADFEMNVRNTLRDVEEAYWDLYLAYRTYDTNVEARNSFLRSWRFAHANKGVGKFSELEEMQSQQAYFQGKAAVEDALQNLYALELQLRRLCGLPSSDGRIIRPKDDPSTGELVADWNICLAEALTRREELRKQKWNIKSLELQLRAAKSLVHPQLNFISSYQINGFGNNLFNIEGARSNGPGGVDVESYFQTQGAANQTGYTLGFQFNMPLGFRQALSQVRNYELRVTKAKELLANQELEVCHELSTTFQNMAWRYQTAQSNYNRWQIAEAQVPGRENRYRTGVPNIDTSVLLQQWLQTRTDAATAEVTFYTSVIEYQKALTDLHYRKGTLLELNNVHLAESSWTPDAYCDALRRAYSRSYAVEAPEIDPVHSEPETLERQGWLGQVELMGTGVPAQPAPEEPADLHSKSGPLSIAPAEPKAPAAAESPEKPALEAPPEN